MPIAPRPARIALAVCLALMLPAVAAAQRDRTPHWVPKTWSLERCDFARSPVAVEFGTQRRGELRDACVVEESGGAMNYYASALYRFTLAEPQAIAVTVTTADFVPHVTVQEIGGAPRLIAARTVHVDRDAPSVPRSTVTLSLGLPRGTYVVAVTRGREPDAVLFEENRRMRFEMGLGLRRLTGTLVASPCSVLPTTGTITLEGAASGVIDPGGCWRPNGSWARFYRLDVPTRRTVVVEARSRAFTPQVTVLDAVGAPEYLEYDRDSTSGRAVHELPAGTYRVEVSAADSAVVEGPFELTVTSQGPVTADSTGELGARCNRRGTTAKLDEPIRLLFTPASCLTNDRYAYHGFALRFDRPTSLYVQHRALRGEADPYLLVTDTTGAMIAADDDGSSYGGEHDASLFTELPAGTYWVYAVDKRRDAISRTEVKFVAKPARGSR